MKEHPGSETETSIAIALVRHGDCYLVGERGPGGPLAGLAEFPGGKRLPNESLEECAVRECREETGLAIRVDRRRCEVVHDYPHGRVRLTFFDCSLTTGATPAGGFRWVPARRLAELDFPEANKRVIEELSSPV